MFDRDPAKTRHIFTRHAQKGVVLPAGMPTYLDHAMQNDGAPNTPVVYAEPRLVTG